ncbi:NAD(P)H-binding protein [Dactylosporangium sp. NPDC048998]|uniref:NAD(P)H-binding protein n=1 Tax=Dactylosporangium sp. NPDC048998 TaxID=3363976 RepID=UPI0037118E04
MTDIDRALVVGATGNIGRHAVALLHERGVAVRGMARDPARLPAGIEPVRGDVRDPDALGRALAGVDAALLIWPLPTADGIEAVAAAMAGEARRVAYVSALTVRDDRPPAESGVWGEVEDAIRRTGVAWTFLRASGFAANTRQWAGNIRAGRVVRVAYPEAARSLIHERDIAEVAARVLTEPGHAGAAYTLTGPAALTQAEQVRILAAAAGRPARVEAATPEEARAQLGWADPGWAEAILRHWASLVDSPEPVTGTVERLTGTPARSFAQWAAEHAAEF